MAEALGMWGKTLEPTAYTWLLKVVTEKRLPGVPRRVLLAPHPRGETPDLYYARTDVVALQEALVGLGQAITIDGDYGPGTTRAVQAVQQGLGLPATGIVDSATLIALNQKLSDAGKSLLDLSPRARIRPDQVVAALHCDDTATNEAIEGALAQLSAHFRRTDMKPTVDGRFDAQTEAAVKAFQAEALLPATGIVDTATVEAMNAALRAAGLPTLNLAPKPPALLVELHFYPGDAERKLYVLRDGQVLDRYGMVGGRNEQRDDPNNPHVDYGPSPAGSYTVVEVNPHTSGAWPYSYVPWGAHLREQAGEIQFRDGTGVWRWATGPQSVFKGRNPPPLERADYLNERGEVRPHWNANDFGHLRGRLRSVRTGVVQGHMIHSSPANQGVGAYFSDTDALIDPVKALDVLHYSHGCEHIHPRDIDEMVAKGYLRPGARFIVHGYDERFSRGNA